MEDRAHVAHADSVTYVITAWIEGTQWRYQVRHVRSGEERYFARLEDVAALMEARGGVPPLASPPDNERGAR